MNTSIAPLKVESLERELRVIEVDAEYLIQMGKVFGLKPSYSLVISTKKFRSWIRSIDNTEKYKTQHK